ncbi:MAG: thiamine phosphate synthase [Candidatus Competibacteraceae bacterium]|uniref:Thiamine-phosphate synthase n=1 Tax=Candidatus Contendobacter odensis Run_B_J11 TaxID=1400861 RepID=A0A7U7J620_9GAMM|nr:thiamine phosphate synthase [Candidatus Contendobacter odensis]MBK8537229.1 thiamine phosphate synthase [Candidatus Competibacteraceae bacterium]MBK8754307.1 thiamine phosphate synthase [Candidatus Competibacteraceae bacterium]CDH47198.1 Thiamine-phosphate synthase [Candidatus Contendobacter odensis Run_B_J11]
MNQPSCHGLYAVTDAVLLPDDRLVHAVEQAILGGARLIQYRDKSTDPARRLIQARALNTLCQRYEVPLIVNDDVELAFQVGAAGVHLGQHDPSLATARDRLGETALIGVSCYDRLDLALAAERAGADQVAFGAFFPSPTKPNEIRPPITLLQEARAVLTVPIVAIGGITPDNAPLLLDAGADVLAVVSAVFAQPDIQTAARRFAALFT